MQSYRYTRKKAAFRPLFSRPGGQLVRLRPTSLFYYLRHGGLRVIDVFPLIPKVILLVTKVFPVVTKVFPSVTKVSVQSPVSSL